jgi:hypothetical protein
MTPSAPCCGDATARASVHKQGMLTAVQARYGAVALDVRTTTQPDAVAARAVGAPQRCARSGRQCLRLPAAAALCSVVMAVPIPSSARCLLGYRA